jgi:F-type H+-transporting ATPase subunit gamma
MAGLKEIKRRLRSVKNTQKITYAMKLVSAAKLRKVQEAVVNSREYTKELNGLLSQISKALDGSQISHPLLERRSSIKKVGLLVIGGQRGLCGGYNTNVNKKCQSFIAEKSAEGLEIYSCLVGKKPAEYFRRRGHRYAEAFEDLPESTAAWPIQQIAEDLATRFSSGELDQVYVVYTRFRSAISQQVQLEQLLPLDAGFSGAVHSEVTASDDSNSSATIFEPSIASVFSALMPRILGSKIRQHALDAKASETAARMTAMDSATKNAKQLSRKLELQHNKIRQARITSELLDIIGGAEAVQ